MYEYELCHHGVKGMKWGVRRAQKKIDKYRKKARQYSSYAKEYAKEGSRRTGSDGARQTDQEIAWMKKLAADNKAKSQKYEAKAQQIEAKQVAKQAKKNASDKKKNDKSVYQQERARQKKHIVTKRAIDIGSRFVNEYTKRHDVNVNGMHVGVHDNVKLVINKMLDYKYMKDTFK